jgi:hypothetical protein
MTSKKQAYVQVKELRLRIVAFLKDRFPGLNHRCFCVGCDLFWNSGPDR